MDYFQTNERYRKQELRNIFNWIVWSLLLGFCVWIGWFWGYNQRATLTASTNDQVIRLGQENGRLEQRLATLSADLDTEKRLRREAQILLGEDGGDSAHERLTRRIAGYLAEGLGEERIDLALQSLEEPLRCRPLEEASVAVATGFFAGRESTAELIGGGMQVFMEGETGEQATRGRPWFDPSRPVSIRVAYLGGEKIHSGTLPFETSIIADSWLIRISASQAQLQGYADIAVEKCSL